MVKNNNEKTSDESKSIANEEDESKAKSFFIKGIEMEKAGQMYEAIQFYRRAVQIVPDIEFKVDVNPKQKDTFIDYPDEG